jgi:hypothetical protein
MKKLTLTNYKKIFITGLLFSICVSAQAFMVDFDVSGTNATGIRNLEIDETFYDVTFVESLASTVAACPGDSGTYPCDLYAANPASGVGNVAGATAAAAQIALALNEDVSIGGDGSPVAESVGPVGLGQLEVLVPWQFDVTACNGGVGGTTGTCAQQAVALEGAGSWGALGIATQEIQSTILVNYARFAPAAAVIPVPPAVWLFGSALGMLGWVRQRARIVATASKEARMSNRV